jgi:hypothetical protein
MKRRSMIRPKRLVTFPVSAQRQATVPALQYKGETAQWWAFLCWYAVDSGNGIRHHGPWATPRDAQRFANSMGAYTRGGATVHKVAPYWYAPAYGRVDGPEQPPGMVAGLPQGS